MLVIGLTGSIGMGKSTVAGMFAKHGIPVLDADLIVHRLYEGEAVAPVEALFPGVAPDGRIDRGLLAAAIGGSRERLHALEKIVHPMVVRAELDFLREQERQGARMALIEIPLLYESAAESRFDVVVVVSAPGDVQRERVLARPGMSEEKFEALLSRQFPDEAKRERADFVVDTGASLADVEAQVAKVVQALEAQEGRVMERLRDMT